MRKTLEAKLLGYHTWSSFEKENFLISLPGEPVDDPFQPQGPDGRFDMSAKVRGNLNFWRENGKLGK